MRPRAERLADQVRLNELLPRATEILSAYPGVREVGVGLRDRKDLAVDESVFRVYVVEKKTPGELAPDAMIPAEVLGVPTDVVVVPLPRQTEDDDKYRPLQGGIQIGNDASSELGTLGCLAQRNSDQTVVLLSNRHVMLAGREAAVTSGEKIGQPAISCCCCCKGNIVGDVVAGRYDGLVDCAIARITGQPGFTNEIQDIGFVFGSAPLNGGGSTVVFGDAVRKRGRTSGLTHGTIMNANIGVGANAAEGRPARTHQIEIKPDPGERVFQAHGDSGAALVDEGNVVVGLMWGVDETTQLAYACRITDVVSALDITIINTGTAGTIPLGSAPAAEELRPAGIDDAPLREIARVLDQSETGRRLLALFDRHGHEINQLLETNRDVKVAWHRFQGPAFTAHVIESAREPERRIPVELEGVTPTNLLIRMSVVLQEHGSPALAAAVAESTLPLLQLFANTGSVHDLIARMGTEDGTLVSAGSTVSTPT